LDRHFNLHYPSDPGFLGARSFYNLSLSLATTPVGLGIPATVRFSKSLSHRIYHRTHSQPYGKQTPLTRCPDIIPLATT
jgi:hypothetical protein